VLADLPRSTEDAIVSGCLLAQAGAVERFFKHVAQDPRARCLLSGGAAAQLADVLDLPLLQVDSLVLDGLRRAAFAAGDVGLE
jgi:type III pantothenate kinase